MTDHAQTVVGRFVWIGWAIVLSVVVVVLSSSAVHQQDKTADVLRQSNADRRHAEASLMQALAKLSEAQESLADAKEIIGMSPGCQVICNEQGIIRRISEDADEIFGWPANELVGGPITKVMDELTAQRHAEAFAEQVKTIKSLGDKFIFKGNYPVECYTKEGKKRQLRIHITGRLKNGGVEFQSIAVPSRTQAVIKPLDKPLDKPLIEAPEGT